MNNRYKISGDIENILTRRTTAKKSVKKSSKLRRKSATKSRPRRQKSVNRRKGGVKLGSAATLRRQQSDIPDIPDNEADREIQRINSQYMNEQDLPEDEEQEMHRENLQYMNEQDLPAGTNKYDHFAIIKNDVQNYLNKKKSPELYSRKFQEMNEFIKYMYSIKDNELNKDFNCDQCWIDFLRGASFTRYLRGAGTKREVFYITPNQDEQSMTTKNDLPDGDYLSYNIQKEFMALIFKDVVMFDFDFKDGADEEKVMDQFKKIVEIGDSVFNMKFTFIVFKSDAGVHVFLLSHNMRHDDLQTIDFMLALCNDIWYCAFSHINGFGIRLNPKKDRPEDFIADPGARVKKEKGTRLLDELVSPEDDFMVKKMGVLDETPLIEVMGDDLRERRFEDMRFIEIQSDYYKKNIKLNYIDSEFTDQNDSIVFIGDIANVNNDVYKRVMKHFIYIQYFKPIKGTRSKNFMCHVGDIILNLDDSDNEVTRIRSDMKKIDDELDRLYAI